MADPKDQKIIAAIVTRMQTILTANGYQTNNGTRVADSRPNWDQTELPAISVFQGRAESQEQSNASRKTVHEMPVMIKVFLERGTDASNARIAIADVKKAIRGTGSQSDNYLAERWPASGIGLAMMTRETAYSIEYAEGTFEITGAQVEIAVQFITDKFNAEQ
ncbi:MAG: hypothetical protein IPL32_19935 [Chloracidobacterium sp.]|nr:hypothetical protein [Chloracidobacterium sp.]